MKYFTKRKSTWTSGGVTYRRAIDPSFSKNVGLNKEIENLGVEQQELELEQMGRCFSGERKSRGRRDEGVAWWGPLTHGWRAQGLGRATCV
jgi:hypothetical protein